jgi:hypothetical protein
MVARGPACEGVVMIPRGRQVVDVHGLSELMGMAFNTARKSRPWDAPGFPAPVNATIASVGRGRRAPLWDRHQVLAYVQGKPIPALPSGSHRDDLLELSEIAEALGADRRRVRLAVRDGILPDATPCGVEHWRRARLAEFQRALAPKPAGRPVRAASEQIRSQLSAALREVSSDPGQPVNASELARRAGVNRHTARRFLNEHATTDSSTPRRG